MFFHPFILIQREKQHINYTYKDYVSLIEDVNMESSYFDKYEVVNVLGVKIGDRVLYNGDIFYNKEKECYYFFCVKSHLTRMGLNNYFSNFFFYKISIDVYKEISIMRFFNNEKYLEEKNLQKYLKKDIQNLDNLEPVTNLLFFKNNADMFQKYNEMNVRNEELNLSELSKMRDILNNTVIDIYSTVDKMKFEFKANKNDVTYILNVQDIKKAFTLNMYLENSYAFSISKKHDYLKIMNFNFHFLLNNVYVLGVELTTEEVNTANTYLKEEKAKNLIGTYPQLRNWSVESFREFFVNYTVEQGLVICANGVNFSLENTSNMILPFEPYCYKKMFCKNIKNIQNKIIKHI